MIPCPLLCMADTVGLSKRATRQGVLTGSSSHIRCEEGQFWKCTLWAALPFNLQVLLDVSELDSLNWGIRK